MVEHLAPDRVSFEVDGGTPTVTLTDVEVSTDQGWTFLNRTTMVVVDGPGDEGFLLGRMTGDGTDLASEGWDDAVGAQGELVVVAAGTSFVATPAG
ncbi:hypothetical protein [Knoellia sp. LjRoot47]|uniref:hypothetical protein n=1 Tax=Knoellia sp. LjRoot47 TaxID=3342330 RepID=UPI003ECD51E1